ncbi:MAG: SufD family Fe-S cluster assembly protein, partial [Gammaproteobacteria bacterium]|nr:SufD family Fe-S cluster assembly protein [Gammaproteobacteria bacterium]
GATIGQLDNNMLFYLQSRGIDAETARALLIFAFVDEIVKHVPFPSIRAHLEAQLVGRLPDADILRAFMSDEESSQ